MRFLKRTWVFYVLINTCLYVLLTGFFLYSDKQTNYDRLSNQLYYDHILLVSNGKNIDWDALDISEQYRVFVGLNPITRVLIKDKSKWTPPMLEGFFPTEDMGPVAIIGKNIKAENTYSDAKGERWLDLMGQTFRVTGIVGAEYATSCDDLIIVFGVQFSESDLAKITFIVDVETDKGAQKIEKYLSTKFPEIHIQQGFIKGTARITKSSYFFRLLTFEILFITALSILIFSRHRHGKYEMSYKVYQICGLPLFDIFIKGASEGLVINFIALGVTSAIGCLGGWFSKTMFEYLIWISLGITLLTLVFDLVFFALNLVKISTYNRRHRRIRAKIHDERLG